MCVNQSAESELKQLELDQSELEELRRQLADYFCEDLATFQLDECISTLNTFTQQFFKAADVRLITPCFCKSCHFSFFE